MIFAYFRVYSKTNSWNLYLFFKVCHLVEVVVEWVDSFVCECVAKGAFRNEIKNTSTKYLEMVALEEHANDFLQ